MKPLTEYHRAKAGENDRRSQCKVCRNTAKRELLRRSPEYRERQYAATRECSKAKYHGDPEYRERLLAQQRARYQNDPEHRERKNQRSQLNRLERYQNDPEYRERCRAYFRERYQNDPEYRERRLQLDQERLAKRSARVRRIRQLLDHFKGREKYLTHIAHIIDARPDAQGLQWLCSRIDELVAQRVYGEA
jgi:hypothetical protein